MSAAIPVSGYDEVNWTDGQDNWRDADATWLQERSVIRVNGDPATNYGGSAEGRVFYNASAHTFVVRNGTTSSSFTTMVGSNKVSIVDGSTTSELKASAASTGTGITFNNTTGAISVPGFSTSGVITSTVSTATGAPFTVASTALVSNLNAEKLNSQAGSYYRNATNLNDGTVAIARGGTGGAATPTAGAVPYGTGTAFAFTAAGAENQVISSKGAAAPVWKYPGIYVCFSTTRPTVGTDDIGQTIYEKDTGNVLVYYGATTGWKPPWNSTWGTLGMATVTDAVLGITSQSWSNITGLSIPAVPIVTGRYYRATLSLSIQQPVFGNTGTDVITSFRIANGNASTIFSTLPKALVKSVDVLPYCTTAIFYADTINSTVQAQYIQANSNNVFIAGADIESELVIQDIGPANARVTHKARTGTTATLTTSTPHPFKSGQRVMISIGDNAFDGLYTLTASTNSANSTLVYTTSTSGAVANTSTSGTVTSAAPSA